MKKFISHHNLKVWLQSSVMNHNKLHFTQNNSTDIADIVPKILKIVSKKKKNFRIFRWENRAAQKPWQSIISTALCRFSRFEPVRAGAKPQRKRIALAPEIAYAATRERQWNEKEFAIVLTFVTGAETSRKSAGNVTQQQHRPRRANRIKRTANLCFAKWPRTRRFSRVRRKQGGKSCGRIAGNVMENPVRARL